MTMDLNAATTASAESVLHYRLCCGYCGNRAMPVEPFERRIPLGDNATIVRYYCSALCREMDDAEGTPVLPCRQCGRTIPSLIFAEHGPLCRVCCPDCRADGV